MIGELPVRRTKLSILKVGPKESIDVQILCDQVFAWSVHWVGGRSFVCPGPTCPACPDWDCRWSGWVVVRVVNLAQGKRRGLLELSATTFDRLHGLFRMEGIDGWFGQAMTASRRGRRSPLILEPIARLETEGVKCVDPLFVWDALATLYALPAVTPGESIEAWETRAKAAAGRALERAVGEVRS